MVGRVLSTKPTSVLGSFTAVIFCFYHIRSLSWPPW